MSDFKKLIKWIYALIVLAFIQEKTANIFGAAICSPPCLLFTNRREIVALDYKTSTTHSVVSGLTNAIAIDVHFSLGYIFWSDVSEQNIKRSAIDGSSVTTIITNVGVCDGLAVEWRTSQLYWTDTTNDEISVSDLSGNNQNTLLSLGLDEPRDIALDPDQGLMIWTDWGTNPKIEKATLSGNQRVALVTSNLHWPNGIELDRGNKRIFWVDGGVDRIESVDYQGNNRKLLLKINGFHPFGVALIPPFLFFTDWVARSFLHKLDADTGDYLISDYITSRLPTGIVAYDSSRQPPVSNQCAVNNGGCSHFCVVTSSGHVCVCPGGLAVKQDGRTCEDKLKKFLLFTDADDKSTNMISLDVNYFYGKILFRLGSQRPIAVDFDPAEDRVYWTDVKQGLIRSAFYNATSLKILFRCNVNVPDGLAIDKVGRNIYWSDTGTNRIEVARLDGTKRKVLIKDGLDEPRAIVLDERNGMMYWTDWGSNPKIEKADMDGASRRSIVTGNLGWPNGLTMDQTTNLLYWADAKLDKIEVSDLNGGNRRLILSSAADIHPFGLTVYQGMLYWTDWNNKSITRLDLSNGNRKMIITGLKKPMDIHLYDSSVASGSHRCATNNGLCSDLCLLKPHGGYQCACPTGIALKPDGKTCDYDTFYRKSSDQYMLFAEANAAEIYKVSLAVPDTPCEPLAIRNNISRPIAVDYDPVEGKVYWTDVTLEQISRAYPNGSGLEIIAKDNVVTPDGVAVDWIGRNLYWTDAGTHKIEVSQLDGSFRTSLVTINVGWPRAIILDIEARKMYWSDWGYLPKIEQANMDGTARTTLVSSGLVWVNSLALDFKNKLLYWCDAQLDKIERVDLQGNNRVLILRLTSATYHHPFGLALYEDALFWSDWSTKSIHKYNMTSSISEVLIRGMGRPMEIHIHDSRTIATRSTSCSNLNGGCSHICLPNPTGHRCFCPEGVQLKPGDQFTCQGVNRCPQLFAPAHGSLKPCINVPGQTCQFSCDKGYLLSGTSVRTCKNDGAWTGIQTQCTAVTCPALPEPSNGVRQGCTGTITETYNTVCQFSCFPGFNDVGSSTRRCLENGSWSGQNFICQANSCPSLVTPPKATLLTPSCTNDYGSSCLYSCQPGYTSSSGNVTRVCSSSGKWTGNDINCTDSQSPSFGVSCPQSPFVAYAEQEKFSALVNWTEPVATDNSGVAPTVTSNYQSPQRFNQGTHVITYTAVDQTGNMASCTITVKVIVINCTSLKVSPGGPLRMSSCSNHYGSKCNFSCPVGYRLNGSSIVTCVAPGNRPPGSWDNPLPSCEDIQPPTFIAPCPGKLLLAYADQDKFSASVNWTKPIAIDNSGVTPSVTSNYQSPQIFSQGTHVITYTAVDQSGNRATCSFNVEVSVINCTLLMIDSGSPLRMSSCGNHYGSKCNFSCATGYRLNGSSTVTCVAPGNKPPGFWDNPVPSCQIISCPPLVTPPRATLLTVPCPSTYGSNCSFSCQTGYTSSSGNVNRTCLSSGQWSGNDIICTDSQPPTFGVSCPGSPVIAYAERDKFSALMNWTEPVATDNSGVAPTVTSKYKSPQRFSQGNHVITYTAVDPSGNNATCTFKVKVLVINCTLLLVDPGSPLRMGSCGSYYGSKCNFSCAIGYRLNGSSTVTCVAPGNKPPGFWDNPVPSCQVISCPPLVTPPRATLLTVPCFSIYGSSCSFSCQTGFTSSSGNVTRTCLPSGQWSGSDINCTDSQPPSFGVSCPGSPLLAYAERDKFTALVNWTEPVATDNSGAAPTVTSNYQSPQRFNQGTHVITYTAVDQSGNSATCTFQVQVLVINCTSLGVDPGGPLHVSSCGNHYGSQCNFSCDIGHRLNGSSTVTCVALSNRPPGFWDNPVPTCQGIKCLSLPAPTHGVKSGCSDPLHERYGTICRFSCNVGYNLTGSSRRQCQENETWTGITPACRVINCSGLVPPANGAVDPSSCLSRSTYGLKCSFSCSKTGYVLEGTSARVCEHDGAWTGENNTLCRDKMTPSFNNTCPRNMVFYVPKCSSTALISWNEPIATDNSGHVIISYPAVRSPANLSIGLYNVHYSATDDEGNTANCTFIVQVARKSCPVLQPPTDGTVTSLSCGSSYGSRALLSCNEGYRLAGSRVRSCQEDRKWSGNVTTCNIISCPQMITPPRATLLTVPCSSTYGSNCSFSCQTGYASSSGNVTRACMSSGQWSGNDINCKDIQPPTFVSCPERPLLRYAERDKFTALLNWTTPVATDNSGVAPTVTSNYGSPQRFNQGTHVITYTAVDQSGNKATCTFTVKVTVINCTTLTVGLGGPLRMSSCGNHYGEMCHFSCDVGYRINGLSTVTCMARDNNPPGFWDNPLPICQEIRCTSLSTPANGLKIGCSDPVSERYGTICSFSCKIGYNMTGSSRRQCMQDETWSGHKITCEDLEAPTINPCPGDIKIFSRESSHNLVLPAVTVTDNVGVDQFIAHPPNGSEVTWGVYDITYTALDKAKNKAYCKFRITIADTPCKDLPAPLNGAKACETKLPEALVCTVHCYPGYDFATKPHEIYACDFEGKWFNAKTQEIIKKPAIPDCSKTFVAEEAWFKIKYYYLTDKCRGGQINEEIAQNFIDIFKSISFGWVTCNKTQPVVCTIQNVKVECGKQIRQRRDTTATIPLTVTFALKVPLSNSSNLSLDLNQTSLQISNDILAALEKVNMSLNVTGVVIVEDTRRPPEIRLTRLVCDEGQVQRGTICVNCPVGYFFIDTRCQSCAVDRYQDQEGQTSCISCPSGTSTFGQQGSKRQQDCQALPSNKSEETKQGLSKAMLIVIAVGAVVLIALIVVGISCAWKYCRGPKSKPDSESSPVGFANQAYDDTDWKESVTFQDLMYSSDA